MFDLFNPFGNSRNSQGHPRFGTSTLLVVLLCLNAFAEDALATKLRPATAQAFDQYVGWVDKRVQQELSSSNGFLVEDFFPAGEKAAVKRDLEGGKIVVRHMPSPVPKGVRFEIQDGEIHHWWGAVLVPGVRLPALLKFLKDYDHHAGKFSDVEQSRLLSQEGNRYRFYFRLKRSKAFVTAIYNTEQECVYTPWSATRESSRSVATRIAEIADPGKASEHENPPGDDRGFLWRLVSWWRFEQTDHGVIVEVESASLSRDVPRVVDFIPWLRGYIRSTPKDSIEDILGTIRNYGKSLK